MSRPAAPKANGEARLREAWLMRLAKRSWSALRLSFDAEKRHHGAQLAAAVLLAYLVSALLRLPEHLWAVMSTLIVMRPNTGGTWEAGLNRACGTMIGALGGLAGVWLEHHGVPALATLLAIVAGLSFASAANAALRSAPVAALIILGAGDLPGHSALQVAALRVGQILIGVTVAMGIALASSRHRADARFRQGSATLLQRLGRQMQQARAEPNEAELENAGAAVRSAIDRLSALAASADRESRLFRRRALSADPRFHRKLAGLTGRIVQDAGLLNRVLRVQPAADQLADEAVRASGAALAAVAECLAGGGRPDLGALARMAADARSSGSGALLAAPLHLLLGDLQRLDALLGKP